MAALLLRRHHDRGIFSMVWGKVLEKKANVIRVYEIVSMKTSYISLLGISEKYEGYHAHCTADPKIKNWLIIIYTNPT